MNAPDGLIPTKLAVLDPGSIVNGEFREMPNRQAHRRLVSEPSELARDVKAAQEAGWLALSYGACRVQHSDGRVWLVEVHQVEPRRDGGGR